MSREIKFRAWDKEKSRWVREYDNRLEDQEDPAYEKEYDEDSGWLDGTVASDLDLVNDRLMIDRYVWEQYTGLKDKNGKEIYEGDIVEYVTHYYGNENRHRKVVEWGEWDSDDFGEPHNLGYSNLSEGMEVIGNIHENPELLGGEE